MNNSKEGDVIWLGSDASASKKVGVFGTVFSGNSGEMCQKVGKKAISLSLLTGPFKAAHGYVG